MSEHCTFVTQINSDELGGTWHPKGGTLDG